MKDLKYLFEISISLIIFVELDIFTLKSYQKHIFSNLRYIKAYLKNKDRVSIKSFKLTPKYSLWTIIAL